MPLNLDSPASTTDRSATSSVHILLPQLRKLIDTAENARQTVLNEADALINELKEAHRALSVIGHLDDRYVIAVTGPQGTGKTTMMQSLYGIPDEYLKVNPGVGEKLPILIVEHSEDRFDADVHRYREGKVQRQSIEASECCKVASSPRIDDVMVELRVPERFFGSEDRGFLLLPGSEKISTSYTELVDHVLPCASTAVVCVDDTSMAQKHTRQEIERLRADLEGAKELYALTKANQSNDSNEELRETVVDTFNLPREKERTVAVGNVSRQENPSWVSDLREAIGRHAAIPRAHQEAQAREIKDILFDVQDAVSDINRKIKAAQASEGQEVKDILSEFDDQVERQREALDEKLESTLQAYRSRATEKVANEITEDESLLKKLKPVIFTETLPDRIDFRELVNQAWQNAGKYGPGVAIAQTLNDVSQEHLPRRKPLTGPKIEDEGHRPRLASRNENPTELIGSFDPQEKEDSGHSSQVPITEETVEDVRIFMGVESPDKFNDPKLSIRAVPALALEATRFGFVGHLSLDETETVEAGLEDIVDEIEAVRGTSRRFLGGVGAMLGLDALPDAEIDVVKELLTAAGVGEGAAAGIAGPAAVALLGAYSTVSVMNTVAQRDIQRADAADAALEKVVDRTKQRVLSVYDRRMKVLRRRVEDRLRKEAGLNQAFTDRINLKKAGNDVDERIRKVREQLPSSV